MAGFPSGKWPFPTSTLPAVPEWGWRVDTPEGWVRWARWAVASLRPLRLALYGDLGAGKTTLVRAFGEVMGFAGAVSSPTFVLHHQYDMAAEAVHHFDLYRLHHAEAVEASGFVEIWETAPTWFIEWPEVAQPYLSFIPHYALHLDVVGNGRRAWLSPVGLSTPAGA